MAVLLVAGVAAAILWTEPRGKPDYPRIEVKQYSDAAFVGLLRKYVDAHGRVDYASWKSSPEDLAALDAFVILLANVSPENRPELFSTGASKRSYWITAYNALVLRGVLDLWPLKSVRDVRLSLTSYVKPGKGFFYDRRVVVGGRVTSLYEIENDVLRKQIRDPRIHFAINCASGSCPALRATDWSDEELDRAAREFVNDPRNVRIEDGRVLLSKIFEWYKEDFLPGNAAGTILDYLVPLAAQPLAAGLKEARDAGYPIRYLEYDWDLNERKP
ncbi:MAG: DUF547 domain-containing protein [Planctomycetes bacterium]|nr:DUF547 domain-containing protein [Planctomycetota bacterium]